LSGAGGNNNAGRTAWPFPLKFSEEDVEDKLLEALGELTLEEVTEARVSSELIKIDPNLLLLPDFDELVEEIVQLIRSWGG